MKANGASKFRNINQLKENSEYFESFQPRVEKVSADSSPLMFFRGNVAAVHCFIHLLLSLPPALLNSITSQLSCVLSLGRLQSLTIFACHCDHRIRFSSSSRLNRHLFWSLKSAQKFETQKHRKKKKHSGLVSFEANKLQVDIQHTTINLRKTVIFWQTKAKVIGNAPFYNVNKKKLLFYNSALCFKKLYHIHQFITGRNSGEDVKIRYSKTIKSENWVKTVLPTRECLPDESLKFEWNIKFDCMK